jgi:hypothetical protein
MSVIATLTYNAYLKMDFDTYNERFEGNYPNLYYKANVRFHYYGNFSMYANNTVTLGGLQTTVSVNTGTTSDSGWYYLGEISEPMYCNRQRSFSWSCSNSGWPSLSGTASLTTPKIGLPSYSCSVKNIDINSLTVTGKLTNNPYNLYTLRLWRASSWKSNNLNGDYTETGLTQKTEYEYHVEPFMADCSGGYLAQTVLKATTLENYAEIVIESVDYTITKGETTDDVTFTVHTSDDEHVKSTTWGDDGTWASGTGLTYTWTGLPKNLETYIKAKTTDTLSRDSDAFIFKFHTTYTYMETWIFDGTEWQHGYSTTLDENKEKYVLSRLYYFNGTQWLPAIPYSKLVRKNYMTCTSDAETTSTSSIVIPNPVWDISPFYDTNGTSVTGTLSFYAKFSGDESVKYRVYVNPTNGVNKYQFTPSYEFEPTSEYVRYSFQITFKSYNASATTSNLMFYRYTSGSGTLSVKEGKLELGNKVTDWIAYEE